jgi:hypothetical protein
MTDREEAEKEPNLVYVDEDERPEAEPFRRDRAGYYTGHLETRVLIDPAWFHFGDPFSASSELQQLVEYARGVTTPVKIELVHPDYLRPNSRGRWPGAFFDESEMRDIGPPRDTEPQLRAKVEAVFAPIRHEFEQLKGRIIERSARGEEVSDEEFIRGAYGRVLFEYPRGLDLLVLYHEHRCDYMLTENPWLLDAAETLKKELAIWIARPEEALEALQLSLRPAGVFIEVVRPLEDDPNAIGLGRLRVGLQGLGFSTFYAVENRKLTSYQTWLGTLMLQSQHRKVIDHGRAAIYHRFPFLLFAFDQARYHWSYSQRFTSSGLHRSDHRFHVAYHLNAFYTMIAGLLDNLAWIWNYYLNFGFEETDPKSRRKCVLTHPHFKAQARGVIPELVALLEEEKFANWIGNLTELKRHPAVHRLPLFLTDIMEQGTDRVISDAASVLEVADGYRIIHDLPGHAELDLTTLYEFMDRMTSIALPVTRGAPTPAGSSHGVTGAEGAERTHHERERAL